MTTVNFLVILVVLLSISTTTYAAKPLKEFKGVMIKPDPSSACTESCMDGYECVIGDGGTIPRCALIDICNPNPCSDGNAICIPYKKGKQYKCIEFNACNPNPCNADETCSILPNGKMKCKKVKNFLRG